MKASIANASAVLLLLLLQVQSAEGFFWCFFLGFFSGFAVGPVTDGLNSLAPISLPIADDAPYTALQVTEFNDVEFDGCQVTFGATITIVGSDTFEILGVPVDIADEEGSVTFSTEFDLVGFLFGGFKVCLLDTTIDLNLPLPEELGAFAGEIESAVEDLIATLFPNPTCF